MAKIIEMVTNVSHELQKPLLDVTKASLVWYDLLHTVYQTTNSSTPSMKLFVSVNAPLRSGSATARSCS